ncbi:MAG: hypothetical protein U9R27_01765, partial [Campylobacterota bacterium]|nr:hypothetical protein [Campylobacterota bacterium]
GRGTKVPRSGYEVDLFKKIKDALSKGKRIDQEQLLLMGLESSIDKKGNVNLQDVFLTIHNVTRLLARPETWWAPKYYPGVLIETPFGTKELTSGSIYGGPNMKGDSIYPIIRDIYDDSPVEGAGKGAKTLAQLTKMRLDNRVKKQLEKLKIELKVETNPGKKKKIQEKIDSLIYNKVLCLKLSRLSASKKRKKALPKAVSLKYRSPATAS